MKYNNTKERYMCMDDHKSIQDEQKLVQELQDQMGFKIVPCEEKMDFGDKKRFKRLELTVAQRMQIGELLQHIPAGAAAGAMAGAYTVKFPHGLPHTLMSLKQGGFGTSIIDHGKIVGSASFYPMMTQAAILGVFTAMSIATGQFFLAQINKELHKINSRLDEILRFLYGDKKAELLSEVNFVKYACDNYVSIMAHGSQRIATISSIQEAKKVAMKDIEFYMKVLDDKIKSASKKDFRPLIEIMDQEIRQIEENLDFSLQLYLMSSLMEVYYAQNYEQDYIDYLEKDIKAYVSNCNEQRLLSYGVLRGYFNSCYVGAKDKAEWQKRKEGLEESIASLKGKYNAICDKLYALLNTSTQKSEYYLIEENEGYSIYYKTSMEER